MPGEVLTVREVETAPGLVFDVSVGGVPDAPLVLMLHGFGVSRHLWQAQVPALAAAGYFAAAPNQRGYAAKARPDATVFANYAIERLVEDALGLVDALGHGGRRFHLVGHDWGGSLAWIIAYRHPERLGSLTILSRPHPMAFMDALKHDPAQSGRSKHHTAFLAPDAASVVLADDAAWLRTRHAAQGVPAEAIRRHLSVIGNPEAMEAALGWYRARGERMPLGPIQVPTLFVWGDADDTVGRMAAEGTAACIVAPYTFAVLPGGGHYAPDQMPDKVNELLLAHLAAHPI